MHTTVNVVLTCHAVVDYKPLVRDFPLDALVAASEMGEGLRTAVVDIFAHMQKASVSSYPLDRLLRLVEAVARDLKTKVLSILGKKRLLDLPLESFEEVRTIERWHFLALVHSIV